MSGDVMFDMSTGVLGFDPGAESLTTLTAGTYRDSVEVGVVWQAISADELERFLLVLAASHRAIRTGHNRTVRDL